MYEIIKNPKRMTRELIDETFKGKWVFLARLEPPPLAHYETAVPLVVADMPFEGNETGIYDMLSFVLNGDHMEIWYTPDNYMASPMFEVFPNEH